ncbi:MurR/RpiR family transcriptional regulator [Ruania alba]|uniref:DNA-binding transcriptional regulator, MurR/RpiR family, contains HTH and SIS domains n=1 Tax=Ruania alba TaxID=648782 RepID=A0A1H5HHR2_9MICO|nr:MurR/RpiR family transcriptional regulator [Ruania alba]SEE27410.1 DNA-binding transcriptional regulator, MurR/RpiR family, contains HTH and SIS domains [Ruania alba]
MVDADQSPGVLAQIRRLLPQLPTAVRRTAEQLLNDPHGSVAGTITELAEAAGTSPGAVSRLCRTLDLDGYPALRVAVTADAASSAHGHWDVDISRTIGPHDPLSDVVRTFEAAQARAVHATLACLDLDAVQAVADAIGTARRVHVYGVSGSGVIARELELRLTRIGVPCWTYADVHDGLVAAVQLTEGDVALAVSHSGETQETLDMVACARERGALTAAITGGHSSSLADLVHHSLLTISAETTFRDGPLAARHSELAVVEVLYLAVSQSTYKRTVQHLADTARAVRPRRPERGTST